MNQFLIAISSGKPWAIKEFLNHYCGRPMQAIEVEAEIRRDDLNEMSHEEIKAEIERLTKQISATPKTSPLDGLTTDELRRIAGLDPS